MANPQEQQTPPLHRIGASGGSGGSEGERIARIEGALPYLATKADVSALQAEVKTLKWLIPLLTTVGLGVLSFLVGVGVFALRLVN